MSLYIDYDDVTRPWLGKYGPVTDSPTDFPFSWAGWFRSTGGGDAFSMAFMFCNAGNVNYKEGALYHNASTDQVQFASKGFDSPSWIGITISGPDVAVDTWFHAGFCAVGASERYGYVDGVQYSSTTTLTNHFVDGAIDDYIFGRHHPSWYAWEGYAHGVTCWNVELNADDFISLATGIPPWLIHPEGIFTCVPHINNWDDQEGVGYKKSMDGWSNSTGDGSGDGDQHPPGVLLG